MGTAEIHSFQNMLARRGVSLALRAAGRRTMCAPALSTETLASTIADCQSKMDSKFVTPYTEEKLAADLEAGSVDSSALKEMFGFNDHLMKTVLQTVGKYNTDKAKIVENEKSVIDWEHYEEAIDDPIVGEMKASYENMMKEVEAGPIADFEKDQQKMVAKTKDVFEGMFAEGRKAEAESQAGMEQAIKDLTALGSQMTGLKEQTIAEVLESDPAMRAEIEEEMKNHQWGA